MTNSNVQIPTEVKTAGGHVLYTSTVLGQGGQGVVCRTKEDNLAIKILSKDDTIVQDIALYEQYKRKIHNVAALKMDDDMTLCVPIAILEAPMCGYVMRLLKGLQPINSLLFNDGDYAEFMLSTGGLKRRLEILIELSRQLARLHSRGYIYCDISLNNVFVANKSDEYTKVWLIDCDNLRTIDAVGSRIYTPGYGAPEVISGLSNNTQFSDCFSFAILVFRLLTNNSPFPERYFDNSSTSSGGWSDTNSEDNNINLPPYFFSYDSAMKDIKRIEFVNGNLTSELKEMLDQTLNYNGQRNPISRPSMRKWHAALINAYSLLMPCTNCNQFMIGSFDNLHNHFSGFCMMCDKTITTSNIGVLGRFYHHQVDQVMDQLKTAKIVDDDFIAANSKLLAESIEKYFYRKIPIYSNLRLYSFHHQDFSIDQYPQEMLHFKQSDNGWICKLVKRDIKVVPKITTTDGNTIRLSPAKWQYFIDPERISIFYRFFGVLINE